MTTLKLRICLGETVLKEAHVISPARLDDKTANEIAEHAIGRATLGLVRDGFTTTDPAAVQAENIIADLKRDARTYGSSYFGAVNCRFERKRYFWQIERGDNLRNEVKEGEASAFIIESLK